MMTDDSLYNPWTSNCYLDWENLSTIPYSSFKEYGITYVYIILASEEWISDHNLVVTCVLYQPKSGNYFECIYRGNEDPLADDSVRHSLSIYQYMKSRMNRDLQVIFRFENNRSSLMLQKNPGTVCIVNNRCLISLYYHYLSRILLYRETYSSMRDRSQYAGSQPS